MEKILERLSESVAAAQNLEELARPLLEMLEVVSGLESTYLTSIDEEAGVQNVDFARNVGDLQIPEGLAVPWSDTLCKRCLEEGRRFTSDVSQLWPDSAAAAALGITTYASAPVMASNGAVIGTLCAASKRSEELSPRARSTLNLFSKLIAQHIEREKLLGELRQSNEYLARFALTDSLTGLPNRRALRDELGRLLARAARDGSYVIVGMIDLDDFKQINDRHGHATGDAFLKACTQRLEGVARDTDMLARVGGDEFVLVAPGPVDAKDADRAAAALAERSVSVTSGRYPLRQTELEYAGVSAGVVAVRFVSVDQALELADAAMYRHKQMRKDARKAAAGAK
ncbi:MAG TPA: sensor domain-containing diguanylate cyclase [Paraburkholderia sp.]|jgi:diguanylate cyclase|nr:sensor domain-containing diguanylate cyclase [Paraburkholderia sp.]